MTPMTNHPIPVPAISLPAPPRAPTMGEALRELSQYRGLLYMLTWRDIKARYKQSAMGFLWAVLMPLLIVGAGLLVKVAYSMSSGKGVNYADLAPIALKSLPWAFFLSAVKFGTNSMVSNPNLVTKIYFPREVFPQPPCWPASSMPASPPRLSSCSWRWPGWASAFNFFGCR